MPHYDYRCAGCEHTFDVLHSMSERPVVVCPACRSKDTRKVPSMFGITVSRNSPRLEKVRDNFRRQGAMRLELKENYGLQTVSPVGGRSLPEVYRDIKSRGGFVKEEMARTAEESDKKARAKQKEWRRKAGKRVTAKRLEAERHRASEAAAKRKIVI